MPDGIHVDYFYALQNSYSYNSGWDLINKITNSTEIIYEYQSTTTNTWEYDYYDFSYTSSKDPKTGETVYEYSGLVQYDVTYSQTDYYYKDVVKRASEMAHENEQYIKNLAGDPPKCTDPPMVSISTRQVNNGPIEVLDPEAVILRNTGGKPTATQRLVAGAVQSELNSIFNTQLAVDGWYGRQSAATVRDLQKELSLPATGVLDAQTFYQLQLAYDSGAEYTRSTRNQQGGNRGGSTSPAYTGNWSYTLPQYNYLYDSTLVDYNGNGIPDQYEGSYAQGTGNALNNSSNITLANSLDKEGEPNSTGRLYNPDGSVKQEREYGPDGKALEDTDYNHGGAGHVFPHKHPWKDGVRQDGIPVAPQPGPAPIQPTPNPNENFNQSSINISAQDVGIAAVGAAVAGILKWIWDTWKAAGSTVPVP
jgi:hypothetical protein